MISDRSMIYSGGPLISRGSTISRGPRRRRWLLRLRPRPAGKGSRSSRRVPTWDASTCRKSPESNNAIFQFVIIAGDLGETRFLQGKTNWREGH